MLLASQGVIDFTSRPRQLGVVFAVQVYSLKSSVETFQLLL